MSICVYDLYLQPAPRAMLLSFCTVTLESLSVSLSMALRRPVYSDWSMGYMPGLQYRDREAGGGERETQRQRCLCFGNINKCFSFQ